jgi:1-acyl-sn-glycerol-3-phosphate acyltransferase
VATLWGRMLTKSAFARVEVIKKFSHDEGNENYVLMANHQSAFDIFILYGYLPFDFTFLSKKEVFQIPLFGLAMKVVDAIAVDRENKASLKKTIKDMENYIRRGRSLLIFPEGTRSEDGELLDFKKGGFLLAKKSNVKILPVTVINSNKILKKGSFLITPCVNVTMILNEPIPVENANLNELMEQVRGVMQENLKKFQSTV